MSGVGHTKGPWRFNSRSMTGAVWAEGEFIASVFPNAPDGWDGSSDFERLEEMRANARLIAAAPDLLEAGIHLLGAFVDAETARGNPRAEEHPSYVAMRAAITRATEPTP